MKRSKIMSLSFITKISNAVVLCALLFGFSANNVLAQGNIIDEVVAVIGDDPILKSEIEDQFLRMQTQGFSYAGDLKCKILEDMMIQKLLLNQAKLDSLEVSESSIIENTDAQINYFISQIGSREKMEEYFGKPSMQIKEEMQVQFRERNLTQQMQSKLTESVKTTPAEIRKYFNGLEKDSIPTVLARYEVQQLISKPKIEQEEIERVKAKLRDYQERVQNNGEDFGMFAILYSEDEGSARRGGELGMMGKGMLVPEFANVAFNLRDPQKVSKVVSTEYGYHIMQLIERRGSRVNVRHILLKPKISQNSREVVMARLDSIADLIREEKVTFEQAALYYSEDKDTRSNGGLLANPGTGASTFEIVQLPQNIAKTAEKMEVGEISTPFKMMNAKDQEVYVIIKLKSKTEAHVATLRDDYQMLKEKVEAVKREKTLNDWIKAQQKETYISIKEDWKNCDFEFVGWVKQ